MGTKIIGRDDMKCGQCKHARNSVCTHPAFNYLRFKPLIIAEEGVSYPAFCPLGTDATHTRAETAAHLTGT